jgi:hypothetical protein
MRKLLEELGTFIKTQETIEGKVYECLKEAIEYIEKQMRYTMPTDSEKVEYLNYIKEHLFDTKIDTLGDTVYRYLGTWGMGNYILDVKGKQPLLFDAIDDKIREYASSREREYTNELAKPSKIKSGEEDKKSESNDINEEGLKKYFKAQFKGMGNGNIDRFSLLIGKIGARKWNGKEVAMIARMIYESYHSINMPTGYEEWHRTFCQLINTKYVRYRLNRTEPSDAIKNIFSIYL